MRPNAIADVLRGRSGEPAPDEASSVVEGRVVRTTVDGLYFSVPDWDVSRNEFGPAPWPMSRVETTALTTGAASAGTAHTHGIAAHDHVETVPVAGWRCLVIFVGGGVENPWVVGVWPS